MKLNEITKDTFYHSLKYGNYAPIMKKLDALKHELALDDLELVYQYHKADETFEVATRIPYKTQIEKTNHFIAKINQKVRDVFSDARYELEYTGTRPESKESYPGTYYKFRVK